MGLYRRPPVRLDGPPVTKRVPHLDNMRIVLELVHPANWKQHPPSPADVAYRGEFMGLGKYNEFFKEVVDVEWYRRNNFC